MRTVLCCATSALDLNTGVWAIGARVSQRSDWNDQEVVMFSLDAYVPPKVSSIQNYLGKKRQGKAIPTWRFPQLPPSYVQTHVLDSKLCKVSAEFCRILQSTGVLQGSSEGPDQKVRQGQVRLVSPVNISVYSSMLRLVQGSNHYQLLHNIMYAYPQE